jgi:hypothetical protein
MKTLKLLALFILLLSSGILQGQEGKSSIRWLLNNKEININHIYFNPNNIESINIDKKLQPNEIQVTTKEKNIRYVSLEKFLGTLSNHDKIFDKSIIPVFIIDNNLIDYPDSVKIDSTFYGEARLQSLSNVNGITDNCKKLTIVNIKLSKTPILYIRGNDIQIPDRLTGK